MPNKTDATPPAVAQSKKMRGTSDAPAAEPEATPATTTKVAERVTVNLTTRSARALDEVATLTGDSKTDAINKALQLYFMVRTAQDAGGGAWIQDTADETPVRSRFY